MADTMRVPRARIVALLGFAARMMVLCVLSFAPLACLRLCQFSQAIARAGNRAEVLCSTGADAAPAHDSLINDIQRVLAALTDYIPAPTHIITPLAALGLNLSVLLLLHCGSPKNPTPPPRYLAH